jgi:16S rRNA (guanine966-N2)-methyltransferase
MINIIGGKYKRAKLEVPIQNVRPTSAIKREAIFSILESYALKNSYNLYEDKCFIDLFAGSGSLGLEAISRGSAFSYFFEIDNEVLNTLTVNCKKICKENQFRIYQQDSTQAIDVNFDYPISGIFIDPPYKLNPFNNLLKKLLDNNIIQKNTITIIETNNKTSFELVNGLSILNERVYGKTKILFLKKN